MNIATKSNKNAKEETKRSSLAFKWVSVVAATITVSFVIFSIAIYSLIRQQLIQNDQGNTEEIVTTFQRRLVEIPDKLEISNVVPQLSPNTNRILNNAPVSNKRENNVFNDDVLATLANRDTTIIIYNLDGEIIFSNGNNVTDRMPDIKDNHVRQLGHTSSGLHLNIYQKIYSDRTHKLTGYLIVDNSMTQTNKILHTIRLWMIGLSLLAIIIFIILSYLVVNIVVVKPIKKMSKISHEINEDPNSQERISNLNRNDELGELANSFNQMLDRMQAYIQQQKQFVGDVSHELRTPVAVIQGHMNLLQRWGKDDPEVLNESINSSLQEANRMKHLIQEMLDLTRAEQIDIQFPNEVTDVNEVLQRTVNNMKMIHPDFRISYDDDLKPHSFIKMYRNHLEQVLIILMDNAIKYSQDRKEVLVDASSDQNSIIITVQDFGEGIALEEQKKIFNRFYRVDKARTREKGGNGLGLSIAQKLVESYHGKISVTSQLGSGSKFKIEFPILKEKQKSS
nr:HAMP domain-containing histidine kinase [Lactobacillus colini]